MISLVSDCTLEGLEISGRNEAEVVLYCRNRTGITISNCIIKNTKNDYTSGDHSPILIDLTKTTNTWVENCTIYNSGYPKLNGNDWGGTAYCIRARDMLLREKKSVSQTAQAVGNRSVYYFSRVFKQHVHYSPQKWVKRNAT